MTQRKYRGLRRPCTLTLHLRSHVRVLGENTRMPAEAVALSFENGVTVVRVTAFGAKTGNIQIDSCNVCGVIAYGGWEPATKTAIDKRMASDGSEKGRVLYARSQLFPRRELAPASALILHLDDNLVRIKHLGHSRHLVEGQRYFSESVLVRCVLVIAIRHGCDRAEWEFRNKALAKACCDDHDFMLVKRVGTRYKGLRKNKFLVEKMLLGD